MSDQEIEEKRLDLDRERLNFEREQWQREAAFKKVEQDRSRLTSPLVIAIFTAAAAGFSNIGLAFVNGLQTRELEKSKSEAALVLEMIRTADPDKAAENLGFLADVGLLSNEQQVERIHSYLKQRKQGQGPSLPPGAGHDFVLPLSNARVIPGPKPGTFIVCTRNLQTGEFGQCKEMTRDQLTGHPKSIDKVP
jgi:hypothetical protein